MHYFIYKYGLIVFFLAAAAFAAVKTGKLTPTGGFTGFIVGLAIFSGAGYTGIAMLATFFIVGTAATAVGINKKQDLGLAEKDKGKRTTGQVLANAGVAAALGLLAILFPEREVLLVMMIAASLASATADTLSSEMGNLYGKRFYNILTWQPDKRGLDGVISLEGTMTGVGGSILIAIIFSIGYGFNVAFAWIVLVGTIGNLFDSVLGASLERKNFLTNDAVNFANTLIAALIVLIFQIVW
jgi:uncharacterized protein (TIGR00297 family)